MNTYQKGNVSEAAFVAKLISMGYTVCMPFGGGSRYDLIFEKDGSFKSVQVKTARLSANTVCFNTCSNNKGLKRKQYIGEVDFIGAYCKENDSCYLVPVNITKKSAMTLRITPVRNGQKTVKMACDFKL